ncbi:MAG: tetratricopeptide repeat protein [Rhodoferax sp.]|nr:tetratricopeptide repeat protein [Rhodoferax sp.]
MVTTQSPALAQALNVDQTLQQAIDAHRLAQFQEAHRLYRLVLQAQPNHPDAHHNLGAMALQHGKAAVGLPHFRAACQVRPDYPQYWLSYANALIEAGQLDAARQLLSQPIPPAVPREAVRGAGIVASPAVPIAAGQGPEQTLQALVPLFTQGRYAELESPARALTQRHPQYGLGWKLLAAALKLQARSAEALEPMQQTVALLPGRPGEPQQLRRHPERPGASCAGRGLLSPRHRTQPTLCRRPLQPGQHAARHGPPPRGGGQLPPRVGDPTQQPLGSHQPGLRPRPLGRAGGRG